MPSLPLTVEALVPFHLGLQEKPNAENTVVQYAQSRHRINIIEAWGSKTAFLKASILEIGCGQGDMSTALAAAVSSNSGDGGRVVAWDPAEGDYGSPLTLAQSQAIIKSHSEVAPYLEFSLTTPLSAVLTPADHYTHVVLAHSLYYFPSPAIVLETFKTLYAHNPPIEQLCLAEHGLEISEPAQLPHLLAVMAQAAFESLRKNCAEDGLGQSNVTTVLSSQKYLEIAIEAGWKLDHETFLTPDEELQDGGWEVGMVVGEKWIGDVDRLLGQSGDTKRELAWVGSMRDATINAVKKVEASGKKVQTMDTWCAVLKRSVH